jgi:predicted O-methyltransferase YrrM
MSISDDDRLERILELERRVQRLSLRNAHLESLPRPGSQRQGNAPASGGSDKSGVGSADVLRQEVTRVRTELQSGLKALESRIYSQLEALLGLYRELDGAPALPPLRGWAMSPDAARVLARLVRSRPNATILELGSGASTILLGRLARSQPATRVISYDHDELWYATTRELLLGEGLQDVVDLRFAPLTDFALEDETYPWYSIDAENLPPLDIVIVDGPPGSLRPDSRYPALPLLSKGCAPQALFVVDDLIREDERRVVRRWLQREDTDLTLWDMTPEKGLAVVQIGVDDDRSGL